MGRCRGLDFLGAVCLDLSFMFRFCNPEWANRFKWIVSELVLEGTFTEKLASIPCTISGLVALGNSVSILKEGFLWSVANGRRAGEKNNNSRPVSQRQLTLIVSCPCRRVMTLVNNVLLPRLPLLTESKAHVLDCSSSSWSNLTTAPTNVSGIGPR